MAGVKLTCQAPGCGTETEEFPEVALAMEMLKLHVSLAGKVVEYGVWAAFKHQFTTYKSLANISGQAVNHLLEYTKFCLTLSANP